MTKLIIQIPCYNEAETLPTTLAALPRTLAGVASVEWLVIDDGSSDDTAAVARENGVHHVVRLPQNQGLAKCFMAGLDACLKLDADIIVNTDADNQYRADDIPKLIEPILSAQADMVIGTRPIEDTSHFSKTKKLLQKIGSWVVRVASRTNVPDAPSGFRAFSRQAARRLNVFNSYTYTLETIIQAGQDAMAITCVPIRTNRDLRPSRLVKSIPSYLKRSAITIIRVFITYKSFKFFFFPGLISFGLGFLLGLRFCYFYFTGDGSGHVQSLILAALLLGVGAFLMVVGLLADLVSVNRRIAEENRWRLRRIEEQLEECLRPSQPASETPQKISAPDRE